MHTATDGAPQLRPPTPCPTWLSQRYASFSAVTAAGSERPSDLFLLTSVQTVLQIPQHVQEVRDGVLRLPRTQRDLKIGDLEIRAVALTAVRPPDASCPQGSCPALGVGMGQPPRSTAELGVGLHCLTGAEKSTPPPGLDLDLLLHSHRPQPQALPLCLKGLNFEKKCAEKCQERESGKTEEHEAMGTALA